MIPSMPELDRAWALLTQDRAAEAREAAAAILAVHPGNVSALVCHAMANWKAEGDLARSIAEVRRAVTLAPNVASIRHNLASLLASAGDSAGAAEEFEAALRIKPDDAVAFQGLTQNMKFTAESELVRAMAALHDRPDLDKGMREYLAYGLAKVFDDLNQPERAIHYALEANALGARPFDLAGEAAALDELGELARLDAFRHARGSGHPSRAPLFIVGMPRAGTTLVEAILARHPDVLPLGESRQIVDVERAALQRRGQGARRNVRHELALSLDRSWLAAQAEAMASRWQARAGRPFAVMTDKTPENAVRLGLVARLFPRARVIHVRRHPLDTGVSNFFQRFAAGQGFSTRLDWIGRRTRQTADSMAIWKTALDLPVLDVSYERLVAEPEAQSRRLAEFAGLKWTEAMLDPAAADRAILTASVWQVRQPIYRSAVDRWRRYAPWLGPMVEAMGGMAWVDREVADIGAAG